MERLNGAIQRYAWGTVDAIPKILGQEPTDEPLAEYWLGAHESAPSRMESGSLDLLLREHPEMLGERSIEAYGAKLPFLMKILSAKHPLSLQVHPDREQALDGFARENASGIPLDARERIYRDDWPKPEILIALGEFEALTGFRDPLVTANLFTQLGVADELGSMIGPLTERRGAAALAEVFLDVLSLDDERRHLVDVVGAAAIQHINDEGPLGEFARTAVELDEIFPGDRGILAALLLNRITLKAGESCYLPPGQMHAYLRGTGIEVMATSNNVIRGGLTAKHLDVAELVRMVNFEPITPVVSGPIAIRPGVEKYDTPCQEFDVWRVNSADSDSQVLLPGKRSARIVLVIDGEVTLNSGTATMTLVRGESAFLSADEVSSTCSGTGWAVVAASGLR